MSRKKVEEASEGAPEWMLTYSDLVTLLLTFFILLFSMATIDKQKFEEIANSLRSTFMRNSNGEAFSFNKGKDVVSLVEENNSTDQEESERNNQPKDKQRDQQEQQETKAEQAQKAQKLKNVQEHLEEAIAKLNLQDYVSVIEEKYSLILRIDSVILFDLGSADIKASGREIMLKIGGMLKELDHEIMIQGHTDNLPIKTPLFPTNWELSTKRATNVVIYLVDKCGLPAEKLTATGNGEFRPIRPNDSEENRQKNRRIDIVIDK